MKVASKFKYIFTVFIGTILTLALHGLTSANSTVPNDANWSIFVSKFSFEAVVMVYFLVAFAVFCFVYYKQQHKLPYTKTLKGLNYGVGIAVIWLWGMVEGVALLGNSFTNEIITGLCDAIPIAIMGILLGVFSKKSYKNIPSKNISLKKIITTIFTITIVFLLGRYLLYSTKVMASAYLIRGVETFAWTLIMGLGFAVSYLLLKSSKTSIMEFCFKILLPNYLVFVIFMPLIFKGIWAGALVRVVFDILFVFLGGYISKFILKE